MSPRPLSPLLLDLGLILPGPLSFVFVLSEGLTSPLLPNFPLLSGITGGFVCLSPSGLVFGLRGYSGGSEERFGGSGFAVLYT